MLSSVLIGGVEFLTKTLIANFSVSDSIGDRIGMAKFSIYGSPAAIGSDILPNATVELYDGTAGGGSSSGEWGSSEFGDAVFGGGGAESDAVRIFYGRIITIIPVAHILGASGTGYTQYDITARTFADLLDGAVVETAITYTGQTDQFIINDLFSDYLSEIATSGVDNTTVIASISFDQQTLRQALKNITDLTGAQAWVDPNKILQYHAPAAIAAPYGISDQPDGITTFAAMEKPTYRWDMPIGANWVKIIGAFGSGGTPITAIREDLVSQGIYGVIKKVWPDRSITTTAEAEARGDVELERYANPVQSGTFATREGGLSIGQLISITLPGQGISGNFVISRVTMTYLDTGVAARAKWVVEFGPYQPDLYRLIRRAIKDPEQRPQTPYAIPPPFSIVPGSFAASIEPVGLVTAAANGAGELAIAKTQNVVYNTTDRKTYRWDTGTGTYRRRMEAGDLEADTVTAGVIAAFAIRAVDTVFEASAIRTADIADAQIGTAHIIDLNVTRGKIADLAVDAAKIALATITFAQIANATIKTANIEDLQVTNAKIANATIESAKIVSLEVSKLTVTTALNLLGGNFQVTNGTFSVNNGDVSLSNAEFVTDSDATFVDIFATSASISNLSTIYAVVNNDLTVTAGVIVMGASTVINSTRDGFFNSLQIGGTEIVSSGRVAAFVDVNVSGVYKVAGNTVVGPRLTDIGAPSFAVLADAQAYCALLRTAFRDHGLMA